MAARRQRLITGSLDTFARGKLDLGKVRRHCSEILRLIATIYTSKVSASDVVRALRAALAS